MTTGKTLVIVESPAKATHIQEFLGNKYIVLASKGHITELAKGGKFGLGIDIANNFKPRYLLSPDKVSTLDMLLKAAKQCDEILIASDPDREGEAIAWHIANRLEGVDKPIKRVVFGEIKKSVVLKAIQNPKEIDEKMFASQEARRILDRLVGFLASPFLMNFFGPKLSAGRVQSVLTRMVIDREIEIENFVPEEFFTIQVNLANDQKQEFATKYFTKLTDQSQADLIKSKLADKNAEYIVSEVIADDEKRGAPAPLVTATLQQIMSKTYGFGADRTMKAAQSLYEAGICTYIRTDSVRAGEESIEEVREWLKTNNYAIPKKPNTFKNKNASQDAHECIRPTDINTLSTDKLISDPDEKTVYKMIWDYFVSSQMTPCVYNTLKVTAHVKGAPSLQVKASGKALKTKGFLDILGVSDDSKIDIPNLKKGEVLQLSGKSPVKLEKKQTQSPPRYSEDKLSKELVAKNIGRPATYADLFSKITARNYVEKKGNVYHATDLGKQIVSVLKQYFTFMDYDYTAKMEDQLDEIAEGKLNQLDMLNKFYPHFKKELNKAYVEHGSVLCEKCSSAMIVRTVKATEEKFLACSAYPRCRHTQNM